MSQDPRYTAVQNCSSTALTLLAGGTILLTSFGLKLLAAGFLDQAALNSILDTPSHNHDKAYKLLQCVTAQVKTSPELFYENYLQVLEQCPPLCALLDSIRQEYDHLQGEPTADKSNSTEATDRPHSPLQLPGPHSGNTSESSTGTEPESLPNPERGPGFICPCGKCDLWKFLEGNCPEKDSVIFPYLDKQSLTQRQKDILKAKANEDSKNIKMQFNVLVLKTRRWLENVSVFTPSELKNSPFLNELGVNFTNLQTFQDIFQALESSHCWSWFSFDVLESIIAVMSDMNMTADFKSYVKAFHEYCSQRRLYECPTCFSKALRELHRPLLVEFPDDIDHMTLQDLKKKFKTNLALIIGVKERNLVLLTYKDGSTVLVYSLPRAVADKVFPLSPEQYKMLAKIGVSKCYLYPEPTKQDQTGGSLKEQKEIGLGSLESLESLRDALSTSSDTEVSSSSDYYSIASEDISLEELKMQFSDLKAENEQLKAKYDRMRKGMEQFIKNQYGVQLNLEKPKHKLASEYKVKQHKRTFREMEKQVDHLRLYKDTLAAEEKSTESDKVVVNKIEDDLKTAIRKKEEARQRVCIEEERLEKLKNLNEPDPRKCTAEGSGVRKAVINSVATVYVSVRDHNNRPCTVPHELTAELKLENNTFTVKVEQVSYNMNTGLYKLRYTANNSGLYKLHITVNGCSIEGSPFEVEASIAPITGIEFPWGIAINSQSEIVVSEYTKHKISLLSKEGVKRLIGKGEGDGQVTYPLGIAIDEVGCIYVCSDDNCVKKFKADGTFLKSSAKHLLNRPRGLKINNNKVYVCDRFNYRILVFDTELNYLNISIGGPGVFRDPWDISFDSESNLYITDHVLNCIKVFNQDETFLRQFGRKGSNDGQFMGPTCIHIHKDLVYVSDFGNHRVSVFNTNGEFKYQFGKCGTGIGEFYAPRGIAIDKGLVYVCDLHNNRVQVFDLSYISS